MRYVILVLLVCLWPLNVDGQVALRSKDEVSGYIALPDESIQLHANTSFLLTGEYLYYKVYCFDSQKGDLTKLSKVGYVELIGKGGERIFKHKILLKEGQGYGDFFVPTEVASGVYKLVAYTNWMRNKNQSVFYQNDVTIVNPYRSNQPELQRSITIHPDSILSTVNDTLPDEIMAKQGNKVSGPLRLLVSQKQLGKRKKVTLSLKSTQTNQNISGHYSVSVRKKELATASFLESKAAPFINEKENNQSSFSVGDSIMLPELRGELFQGIVTALEDGRPVKDLKIGVSIPGDDYVLEIVQTDARGGFTVNVVKGYSGEKMVLQVLSQNPEDYSIEIKEPKVLDHDQLDFKPIDIDFSMREEILRRSVHNQIENSYFQFRPDSILSVLPKRFFDNKTKKTYELDDYSRFKTLRETFVEIIQDVSSSRIAKDDYSIRVKGYDYASVTDIPPLILLDGCLVQDHNALLTFDARMIQAIEVFRDTFIFGPEIYEGALILTTKDGKGYEMVYNKTGISTFDLLKPQSAKKYFVQRYDAIEAIKTDERLPDDRLQLLWIPQLNVDQNQVQIDFFTSDVTGEFEIRLEGVTKDKTPVSLRESILVE
ncbi:MAG: hypothetical protein Mars2KO_30600 [Maribacter sp.]